MKEEEGRGKRSIEGGYLRLYHIFSKLRINTGGRCGYVTFVLILERVEIAILFLDVAKVA
jgi:hypothetical protein